MATIEIQVEKGWKLTADQLPEHPHMKAAVGAFHQAMEAFHHPEVMFGEYYNAHFDIKRFAREAFNKSCLKNDVPMFVMGQGDKLTFRYFPQPDPDRFFFREVFSHMNGAPEVEVLPRGANIDDPDGSPDAVLVFESRGDGWSIGLPGGEIFDTLDEAKGLIRNIMGIEP